MYSVLKERDTHVHTKTSNFTLWEAQTFSRELVATKQWKGLQTSLNGSHTMEYYREVKMNELPLYVNDTKTYE
jgi:hypothetical protein